MKTNRGFSLIELIIVIAILGIVASIASFSWQRYVNNTNLRNAAREIAADISTMKLKATTKADTQYSLVFSLTGGQYEVQETVDAVTTTTQTKKLSDFGPGLSIKNLPGGVGLYTLAFLSRGTLSAPGTITLQNSRGSESKIIFNITGKTHVTFSMQ